MVTNEANKALAAIDDLDAVLDRIAVLPLHALMTRQKSALLAQLEAVRLMLSAMMISAAGCRTTIDSRANLRGFANASLRD